MTSAPMAASEIEAYMDRIHQGDADRYADDWRDCQAPWCRKARKVLGLPDVISCTGLTAVWCPIHGDCTCEWKGEGFGPGAEECNLHSSASDHAEGVISDATPARR